MEEVDKDRANWKTVFFLLLEGFLLAVGTVQFASEDENIKMTCPYKNVNKWQKIETQDILAACEYNITEINQAISNRMSVTDDCVNLSINSFTKKDVGRYRCYELGNNKPRVWDFIIKIRALKVIGAHDSNLIQGIEGKTVTLTCFMVGANQETTLYWTAAETILESNTSNCVIYQFTTQRMDTNKKFTCTSNGHTPNVTVQLNLILIPRVSVISSLTPPTVEKGHTIVLRCQTEAGNNGTINTYEWRHDGKLLSNITNTLQFENAKPTDAGKYCCTASNSAGTDSAVIDVIVTYFPVVQNETIYFKRSDRPRTLKCKVLGVPDTYSYSKWLHYTYSNQLVRTLYGQANGTLILPKGDQKDLMYEDSGLYICNVTNNVRDKDGNIWQTGSINLVVKGKPVLAKPRKYNYTGRFNETSSVNLVVLSFSNISNAEWYNVSGTRLESKSCTFSAAETEQFGQLLKVPAYICSYLIPNTKIEDFKNYTVRIANECGERTFNISLMSAREPEEPKSIQLRSSSNHIYVEFKPGFNGGYPQSFIIEYRKASAGHWTRCEVYNSDTHYNIENLEFGTEYQFRMYSFNKLGNSTVADGYSIHTKDETNSSGTKYIGFTVGCVLLVCIVVTLWRFRKAKKNEFQRSISNEQQIQGGGLIINIPHGSAVDLNMSSLASAGRVDVYSSIDRRKHNLYNQKVTYQNAKEEKRKKSKLTDRTEWKGNSERGSSTLHYTEVVFEPKPHIGRFYIHGADSRTPYADIDFSLTADPLTSFDEESVSSHEENNDFVSLEDVQQWNIHES